MANITFYMAQDDHKWLVARAKRLAELQNRTMSWVIVEGLRMILDKYDIEELEREEKQRTLPLGTA